MTRKGFYAGAMLAVNAAAHRDSLYSLGKLPVIRLTLLLKLNESFAAMMGGFQAVRAKRSGLHIQGVVCYSLVHLQHCRVFALSLT